MRRRLVYLFGREMPAPMASTVNITKNCAAIAAEGCDVTLVHFRGRGELSTYYGLSHRFRTVALPIPSRWRGSMRVLTWTGALLARLTGATVYARKAAFLVPAARLGCPVALELHAPMATDSRASRAAFSALLKRKELRAIIVISRALAQRIADEWPLSERLIFVAPDGADAGPEPAPAAPRNGHGPLLGYAGHLYPGKGMETIAALAQACPDWSFLVIGGRPEDVASWREKTADLSNIVFTGLIPHAEVSARLANADILLAPYGRSVIVSDGRTDVSQWMSPLKLFEYMALAKPIVASDLPVLREVLKDRENARLAQPDDPNDWRRVIAELLSSPANAAEMGRRARMELEQKYSWQRRARAMAEVVFG